VGRPLGDLLALDHFAIDTQDLGPLTRGSLLAVVVVVEMLAVEARQVVGPLLVEARAVVGGKQLVVEPLELQQA